MRVPSVVACFAAALFIGHAVYWVMPPAEIPAEPSSTPSDVPDVPAVIPATLESRSKDEFWDAKSAELKSWDSKSFGSRFWGSSRTSTSAAAAFAYTRNHPATPLPALSFAALSSPDGAGADYPNATDEPHETPMDVGAGRLQAMSRNSLCSAIVAVARANDLPVPFFANLIWQESSFLSRTVSHAGAQGIAQFIPETAIEHELMNPFEPVHALFASGKLLRKLTDQFGNLGLAAAAYNAGPQRVRAWIAERRTLPGETRAYVVRITGHAADRWASNEFARGAEATLMPAKAPCPEVAEDVKAQARIVRVSRLMSEIAAATAPPQNQLRIAGGARLAGKWAAPGAVPLPPKKPKELTRLASEQPKPAFSLAAWAQSTFGGEAAMKDQSRPTAPRESPTTAAAARDSAQKRIAAR